jgi:hypothetical protein
MEEPTGERWTAPDGTTHTVKSTDDPRVPDGFFHSQTDSSGNKSTAVYNSDYSMADVPTNDEWDD